MSLQHTINERHVNPTRERGRETERDRERERERENSLTSHRMHNRSMIAKLQAERKKEKELEHALQEEEKKERELEAKLQEERQRERELEKTLKEEKQKEKELVNLLEESKEVEEGLQQLVRKSEEERDEAMRRANGLQARVNDLEALLAEVRGERELSLEREKEQRETMAELAEKLRLETEAKKDKEAKIRDLHTAMKDMVSANEQLTESKKRGV